MKKKGLGDHLDDGLQRVVDAWATARWPGKVWKAVAGVSVSFRAVLVVSTFGLAVLNGVIRYRNEVEANGLAAQLPQDPAARARQVELIEHLRSSPSLLLIGSQLFLVVFLGSELRRDRRAALRKRRVAAGLCAHCGYDLRESPGRCPECGGRRLVSDTIH